MKLSRVLQLFWLFVFVVLLFFITVPIVATFKSNVYDMCIITTFMLNGIIILCLLIAEVRKRPYSLAMIHWVFCLFFLVFAATSQYITKSFCWDVKPSDELIFRANIVCFIWIVCFTLGLHCKNTYKHALKMSNNTVAVGGVQRIKKRQTLFLVINVILTAYQLAKYGFSGNLVRGSSMVKIEISSLGMLVGHCLMAFMTLTTVSSALLMRKRKKYRLFFAVNIACMLLTYFPTVMARNSLAGAYGGIFIALFPKLKKNRKFILILIMGLLIIFPMFNAFRYTAFSNVDAVSAFELSLSNMPLMWQHPDFDAYSVLLMSLEYTEKSGSTHGWQLFGALMFWWPRVLWPSWLPEKPGGSGHYLAKSKGNSFTNISCTPAAEGNINFGIIGVVAFGLVFGAIVGAIDRCY